MRRETWSVSTESSSIQQTTLSSRSRFSRPGYHRARSTLFSFTLSFPSQRSLRPRARFSRSLSSTLDWTERLLFQARERPRTKCFPGRLSRRLGRLSTNNPRRVPRSKVRYTTNGAGSDLESRQGASRPH